MACVLATVIILVCPLILILQIRMSAQIILTTVRKTVQIHQVLSTAAVTKDMNSIQMDSPVLVSAVITILVYVCVQTPNVTFVSRY